MEETAKERKKRLRRERNKKWRKKPEVIDQEQKRA
jgi:hypothetical protein